MRTFIAIEIPESIHPYLRRQQQQLETVLAAADQSQTIHWTPPEKIHLTLRFLGETSHQQRQVLQQALAHLATQQKPFILSIGGVGCFPSVQAPSIVWLDVKYTGKELLSLQQQVEQVVQLAGFAAEGKSFRPHLTIGRMPRSLARQQVKKIGQTLAQHLPATQDAQTGEFEIHRIVHMQSQLQPTGAVYTPLQIFKWGESYPEEE